MMLNTILVGVSVALLSIYLLFKKVFPDIAPHLPGVSVWPQAFNLSKFQAYLTQQAIKHGGPFFKVQSIQTAIVVTQPSSAKVKRLK
jgi:hypothetical protein